MNPIRSVGGYPPGYNPFGDDEDDIPTARDMPLAAGRDHAPPGQAIRRDAGHGGSSAGAGRQDGYPAQYNPFSDDEDDPAAMGNNASGVASGAYATPARRPMAPQHSLAADANTNTDSPVIGKAERKPVPKPRSSIRAAHGKASSGAADIAANDAVNDVVSDSGNDASVGGFVDTPGRLAQSLYAQIRKTSADSGYPSDPSSTDSDHAYSAIEEPAPAFRRLPSAPVAAPPATVPVGATAWVPPLDRLDVGIALATLGSALNAATPVDASATAVRAKRSGPPLNTRCANLHRALLRIEQKYPASIKQAARMVAALGRQATVAGYAELQTALIRDTLAPRLHVHTVDQLCALARLADRNDKTRQDLAREIARALGTGKRRTAPKAQAAKAQQDVAEALLNFIGELAKAHAIEQSWDTRIAALLAAAGRGAATEIDAALQDMWSGDEALADPAEPRRKRLLDYIRRLPADQRQALAAMLGVSTEPGAPRRDAGLLGRLPHHFAMYEQVQMRQLQADATLRHQMRKYLQDLRAAAMAATPGHPAQAEAAVIARADRAPAERNAFPPRIRRKLSLGTRLRRRLSAFFSRRGTTANELKTQVRATVSGILKNGRLTEEHSMELTRALRNVVAKRGESKATDMLSGHIGACLDKLDPAQLSSLRAHVADALSSAPLNRLSGTHPLRRFHAGLARALDQEPGIRHCANALTLLTPALRHLRRPDAMLRALDGLADARLHLTADQSELDLYEAALARLDPSVRANIRKQLNGRRGVTRHAAAIQAHGFYSGPWSRYRRHQFDVLARAVST
jgi:hypothetical protein